MDDELSNIEDAHAWFSFGQQGFHIYKGAREEGATHPVAMQIVVAVMAGMMMGGKEPPEQ